MFAREKACHFEIIESRILAGIAAFVFVCMLLTGKSAYLPGSVETAAAVLAAVCSRMHARYYVGFPMSIRRHRFLIVLTTLVEAGFGVLGGPFLALGIFPAYKFIRRIHFQAKSIGGR